MWKMTKVLVLSPPCLDTSCQYITSKPGHLVEMQNHPSLPFLPPSLGSASLCSQTLTNWPLSRQPGTTQLSNPSILSKVGERLVEAIAATSRTSREAFPMPPTFVRSRWSAFSHGVVRKPGEMVVRTTLGGDAETALSNLSIRLHPSLLSLSLTVTVALWQAWAH